MKIGNVRGLITATVLFHRGKAVNISDVPTGLGVYLATLTATSEERQTTTTLNETASLTSVQEPNIHAIGYQQHPISVAPDQEQIISPPVAANVPPQPPINLALEESVTRAGNIVESTKVCLV